VRSRIAEEPWGVGLGDLVEQTVRWVGSEEELREKPIRPAGSAASRASPYAERRGERRTIRRRRRRLYRRGRQQVAGRFHSAGSIVAWLIQ
jgi:hypothetical protein